MELTTIMPWGIGVFIVAILLYSTATDSRSARYTWVVPAVASFVFFLWSLWAAVTEGSLGFWTEHTRNKWGNQIWFDLLFGVTIGWWVLLPHARALGMRVWLWLPIVLGTGSIGFLAMISRYLYLKANLTKTVATGNIP